MAPENPNQKRKRGPITTADAYDEADKDSHVPRKRRRDLEQAEAEAAPVRRSRRGQPPANNQQTISGAKPGINRGGAEEKEEEGEEKEEEFVKAAKTTKKRGRSPADDAQKENRPMQELRPRGKRKEARFEPATQSEAKPKARRDQAPPLVQASNTMAAEQPTRRRSARVSDPKKRETAKPTQKPRVTGRDVGHKNTVSAEANDAHPPQGRRSGDGRGKEKAEAVEEAEEEPEAEPNDDDNDNEDQTNNKARQAPKFRQLMPLMRQIPRSTVAAKWTTLDETAIAAVSSVVSDAARAVLLRLRDRGQQRHDQAQHMLGAFASRLQSKLRKGLPFPPPSGASAGRSDRGRRGGGGGSSGHGDELDFEKTVDAIQETEKTLDPLLHSVALLQREKAREEEDLERDYALLRTLETNARAEAASWREREKRAHALAPEPRRPGGDNGNDGYADDDDDDDDDPGGALVLARPAPKYGVGILKDLEDEEIKGFWQQTGSHMQSMRANLSQIDGVLPAIVQSKAALRGVLFENLSAEQYEEVLLG